MKRTSVRFLSFFLVSALGCNPPYPEFTERIIDDPNAVVVLFNQRKNEWAQKVISQGGSHSMRILDVDGDGDLDIFGANWNGNAVKAWLNELH